MWSKRSKRKSLGSDELLLIHDGIGKTFRILDIQVVGIKGVNVYQFFKFI